MSPIADSEIIFESEHTVEGLEDQVRLEKWIKEVLLREKKRLERLAYFVVTDNELLAMNKEYLDHDTLTDILTFPYSYDPIAADIYISFERVIDNASTLQCTADEEMRRVVIHGVLHMCGWTDKTESDNAAMRKREDECLAIWSSI